MPEEPVVLLETLMPVVAVPVFCVEFDVKHKVAEPDWGAGDPACKKV